MRRGGTTARAVYKPSAQSVYVAYQPPGAGSLLAAARERPAQAPVAVGNGATPQGLTLGKKCGECGASAVIKKDGCDFCTNCGNLGSCG